MVWNLMFWFAVAYLGIAVIWRYFVPAFSPSAKPRRDKTETVPVSGAEQFFARSRLFPILALVLLVIPPVVKSAEEWRLFGWSQHEKEQLVHFTAAMDYYDQATQISAGRNTNLDEWESVKALLEAAASEGSLVSDTVLRKVNREMPEHFRPKFLAGLNAGIYGLSQYTIGKPKGAVSLPRNVQDSLDYGRQMLAMWDDWYLPREQAIFLEIGELESEE